MTSSSVIAVPSSAWLHPSLPMQTYLCPSFLAGYIVCLDPDDRRRLLGSGSSVCDSSVIMRTVCARATDPCLCPSLPFDKSLRGVLTTYCSAIMVWMNLPSREEYGMHACSLAANLNTQCLVPGNCRRTMQLLGG